MSEEVPQARSKLSQQSKDRTAREIAKYSSPEVFVNIRSFEATLEDRRVFTHTMLEQAAEQIEQVRNLHLGNTMQVRIPHFLGSGEELIQMSGDEIMGACPLWVQTFWLAKEDGKVPLYYIQTSNNETEITAFETLRTNDTEHPIRQQVASMPNPPQLKEIRGLEDALSTSLFWARLQKRLDDLKVEVKNIVCVALGRPYEYKQAGERDKLDGFCCSQHLLACAISKYFTQRYKSTDTSSADERKVPIITYDPSYTFEDVHLLSKFSPPITVVSDPYHYLSITPSTLVIAIGCPAFVPIFEIAADLCFPSGPAAILCDELYENDWNAEGNLTCLDRRTPRVDSMLKLYDANWLSTEEDVFTPTFPSGDLDWTQHMFLYARKEQNSSS